MNPAHTRRSALQRGLKAGSALGRPCRLSGAGQCADASRLSTERLRGDTAQPVGDMPAQYGAFIRAEQARWKQVIARAKIKAD